MTLKKVKLLKIERILLASVYVYLMFNQTEFNTELRTSYVIVTAIVLFCALVIGIIIPKDNRLGNTFLKEKYKWLELTLEIGLMLLIVWFLCQF